MTDADVTRCTTALMVVTMKEAFVCEPIDLYDTNIYNIRSSPNPLVNDTTTQAPIARVNGRNLARCDSLLRCAKDDAQSLGISARDQ